MVQERNKKDKVHETFTSAAATSDENMWATSRLSSEFFGFRKVVNSNFKRATVAPGKSFATSGDRLNPQNLPHLPVPQLEVTLEKYLKSVKPHLNEQEFAKTCNIVKQFAQQDGPKLQKALEKRASESLNWLEDWWLNSAYLDYRSSVVINSNPGLVFPLRKFSSRDEHLVFAAKMIKAALDYKLTIDINAIPLEKIGNDPLDMQQYKKIFGTCRVPGISRDKLSFNNSKHIIVMHKSQIFFVPVWDDQGNLLDEHNILNQLKSVLKSTLQTSKAPIGMLTSEHRDAWGAAYQELIKDNTNVQNLKKIEEGLFLMCLDESVGLWNHKEKWQRQTTAGHQTIHGGGSKSNSGNRWYDKTVQLIVGEDGVNGLCYEHSPAEGVPIAVMTDYVVKRLDEGKKTIDETTQAPVQSPQKLEFNITPVIESAIAKAKENIDQMAHGFELNCFTFDKYGKDFIKKQKMSPDSFIQMAIQFAFYRLHKVPGAQYESAATRKYVGGRTETIRSCSEESIAFSKSMLDPSVSPQDRAAALHAAVKAHKQYTVDAINGLGVDRHLLGLKLTALGYNMAIPELYQDKGFAISSAMRLSTSQVGAACDGFMCYGPLVENGYGTCYNPRKDDIIFGTSAYHFNKETSCTKYRKALETSLLDMRDALIQASKSKL